MEAAPDMADAAVTAPFFGTRAVAAPFLASFVKGDEDAGFSATFSAPFLRPPAAALALLGGDLPLPLLPNLPAAPSPMLDLPGGELPSNAELPSEATSCDRPDAFCGL